MAIDSCGATRPGMANLTRAVLSKVMEYAIEDGVRDDNPFAGLKRYRLGTINLNADGHLGHASDLRLCCCSIPASAAATS
jgi:hypothetical protein